MIEVKNVTKKYGDFVAVNNINFKIEDNEIVGFLGPNGAGKSTTMNMITGFIEPTKGKIIVNGYDISRSPKKAKKEIGYMPEGVPLYYDLTVKEFISYMADLKNVKRKDKKDEVNKVMDEMGLTDVQNKLIKNVSRGYKQRVSLAGALVGNPKILILDEPTVGLDPRQITEIRSLIKSLGKKHTIILSSHILSEVSQICEKVIIINKGNIVAVDTPDHLEKKTQNENRIVVTVEEKKNKISDVCKDIKEIKKIEVLNKNDDGTIKYLITSSADSDVRKKLFEVLPKNDITIFELKNDENTLEDAFLSIVNNKDDEAKNKVQAEKEKKEKRAEEISKMDKKDRKLAIKEDKKKEKQEAKERFEKEWEEEERIAKEEKEEKKKKKLEKKEAKKKEKEQKKKIKDEKKDSNKKEEKAELKSKNSDTKKEEKAKSQNKKEEKVELKKGSKKVNKVESKNKNEVNKNKGNNTNKNNQKSKKSNQKGGKK